MNELQKMINKLTMIPGDLYPLKDEDLSAYERKFQKKLPNDYKYFCQVLGSGVIDDIFDIRTPPALTIGKSQEDFKSFIVRVESALNTLETDERDIALADANIKLLKSGNCFTFGSHFGGSNIFFDLNTYSKDDDSCKIYWFRDNAAYELQDKKLIANSFTDFICNFCCGKRAYKMFPSIWENAGRKIEYTFEGVFYEW